MNTIKYFILAACLAQSSISTCVQNEAELHQKIAEHILRGQIKEALLMAGVSVGIGVTTGVASFLAIEAYKATKNLGHRLIYGPSLQDQIIELQMDKNRQAYEEKEIALAFARLKLEKEGIATYVSTMKTNIQEASPEEKASIEKKLVENLKLMAEAQRNRVLGAHRGATPMAPSSNNVTQEEQEIVDGRSRLLQSAA